MNIVFLIIGILLVIAAIADALWTTLWVDGSAGPLSSHLTTSMWRGLLKIIGRNRHRTLSIAGPVVLFSTILMWVILLWLGWVLVFAGGDGALMHSSKHYPAGWAGRIYFVAYMMFTAGNGDFSPQGSGWQIAASLTNGSGMIVVTLAITYLLSVVSAVVQKRTVGSEVAGFGRTAEEFIRAGWNGKNFHALDLPLSGISARVATLSEQYLAYPVLQYYHAAKASKSPVVAMLVLDEALTILRYGIPESVRPNPAVLRSARSAVSSFLETMPSAFIHAAPEPLPSPSLQKLRDCGIPTVDDGEFQAALEEQKERRCKLLGLLRHDGWNLSEL